MKLPTIKLPLNRIIAFFGPYISLLAGALSAWLIAKMNVLAIPGLGLNGDMLETAIAAGLSGLLTSTLLHLGQMKWLKGVHIELVNEGLALAAANQPPAPPALLPYATLERPALLDPDADAVADDELPGDDVELAAPPPPDESNTPVQPSQAGLTD